MYFICIMKSGGAVYSLLTSVTLDLQSQDLAIRSTSLSTIPCSS